MLRMNAARNIHRAVQTYRQAIGEEIHHLPGDVKRTYKWLRDQGYV